MECTFQSGHAKKEVRVGRGRIRGTVPCRGERRSGTEGCVFAWCLMPVVHFHGAACMLATDSQRSLSYYSMCSLTIECVILLEVLCNGAVYSSSRQSAQAADQDERNKRRKYAENGCDDPWGTPRYLTTFA